VSGLIWSTAHAAEFLPTSKYIRADNEGPVPGLIRELRIRWILFRRAHKLAPWQLMGIVAAILALSIGVAAYGSHRSDQGLSRQLVKLQAQAQILGNQVKAQQQEVADAGSPAWQQELARADGLAAPGQKVYAIESRAQAAGPAAVEQGVAQVGQAVEEIAQGALALG
jgi:hypothetical protein